MVGYAYNLDDRRSSRIIEQAIRQHATIWAETLDQEQPQSFSAILESSGEDTISINLNSSSLEKYTPFAGQYYQLQINLGETRYLTVCDLQDIKAELDNKLTLVFSRPKTIQVMQRRQYHRYTPGQALPVFISWETLEGEDSKIQTPALGQVRDLSRQGMSLQVPDSLDHHLFIGDTVYARFSLNVKDSEYFTSACVTYKELNKKKSELIIGLQFLNTEENNEFQARLQTVLNQNFVSKKGF